MTKEKITYHNSLTIMDRTDKKTSMIENSSELKKEIVNGILSKMSPRNKSLLLKTILEKGNTIVESDSTPTKVQNQGIHDYESMLCLMSACTMCPPDETGRMTIDPVAADILLQRCSSAIWEMYCNGQHKELFCDPSLQEYFDEILTTMKN